VKSVSVTPAPRSQRWTFQEEECCSACNCGAGVVHLQGKFMSVSCVIMCEEGNTYIYAQHSVTNYFHVHFVRRNEVNVLVFRLCEPTVLLKQ
jgi:hypothetical protein